MCVCQSMWKMDRYSFMKVDSNHTLYVTFREK